MVRPHTPPTTDPEVPAAPRASESSVREPPVDRTAAVPPRLLEGHSGRHYLLAHSLATGAVGRFRYAMDGSGAAWGAFESNSAAGEAEMALLRQLKPRLALTDEIHADGRHFGITALPAGELGDLLPRWREPSARQGLARHVVWHLAGELAQLHDAGLVLRGLRPNGVLWGEDGAFWLGDYADAAPPATGPLASVSAFTAPEVASSGTYGVSADVWSLGLLWASMHDSRLPRLFTLTSRGKELWTSYRLWRDELRRTEGSYLERLARHKSRWSEAFLPLCQADEPMTRLLIERMLDVHAGLRAAARDIARAVRQMQPLNGPAERDTQRHLANLAGQNPRREAALLALRHQIRRLHPQKAE